MVYSVVSRGISGLIDRTVVVRALIVCVAILLSSVAGFADSIVLMSGAAPVSDTVRLSAPAGFIYVAAWGYDDNGNKIGVISMNWTASGTLHAIAPLSGGALYYTAATVIGREEGFVTATATSNPTGSSRFYVIISPPPATITQAITGDKNGDGYLDRIEVHFSRSVSIPASASYPNVLVVYSGRIEDVNFTVASVVPRTPNALSDTVLYFELNQVENSQPQTSWAPTVQITGHPDMDPGLVYQCTDGAGPMVWRVVKEVNDVNDRSKDVVTVTFSENLDRVPGATDAPRAVFTAWIREPGGTFAAVDSLLPGIDYFLVSTTPDAAKFQMTNGKNLTSAHFISIRMTSQPPAVVDRAAKNPPTIDNRKTRMEVIGDPSEVIQPITKRTPPVSESPDSGGCGAGFGLAFLPPMIFKARSGWRRRRVLEG